VIAWRRDAADFRQGNYFTRIRQAELEENMNLIDGFIYRESYVYIDKYGNLLDSQLILDDTESLYRDTTVYRYDSTGTSFSNPDSNYLHTIIEMTTEIFGRNLEIGLTEYLPAGPTQISEIDTSRYEDIDFIVYGHLHKIDIRYGKPLVINPGECCSWLTGRSTVVLLDISDMNAELIDL